MRHITDNHECKTTRCHVNGNQVYFSWNLYGGRAKARKEAKKYLSETPINKSPVEHRMTHRNTSGVVGVSAVLTRSRELRAWRAHWCVNGKPLSLDFKLSEFSEWQCKRKAIAYRNKMIAKKLKDQTDG